MAGDVRVGAFNVLNGGNFINEADDYSPGASPGLVNVGNGGTFTNAAGLAQQFTRAIPPPEGVRTAWRTIVAIASALGLDLSYTKTGEVAKDMNAPREAANAPAAV